MYHTYREWCFHLSSGANNPILNFQTFEASIMTNRIQKNKNYEMQKPDPILSSHFPSKTIFEKMVAFFLSANFLKLNFKKTTHFIELWWSEVNLPEGSILHTPYYMYMILSWSSIIINTKDLQKSNYNNIKISLINFLCKKMY